MSGVPAAPEGERRCRRPDRPPLPPGALRPTDVVGGFFIAGLFLAAAGAVVAIANGLDPWSWGRWLALHLVFVGGISQLVIGASQFFAGAFLATDPPPRRLIRGQLVGWNLGAIILAIAVPAGSEVLTYIAAACLISTLAAYMAGLLGMRRRSLGSAPWASRWYIVAAAFFAVGIVAGVMLATGAAWSHGNLLAAHMALNVGGWFGTAIVGTLHTFYPSLTGSRLRFPHLQLPTFGAWTVGVAALGIGYGLSADPAALAGWVLLSLAGILLVANVAGSLIAASRRLSLPARLVGAAQVFLLAGVLIATAEALGAGAPQALTGSTRDAVGTLLIAGWIGLTVIGSLLHLLALLVRVRDLSRGMPEPRPLRDTALTALAVTAVAAVAARQLAGGAGPEPVTAALLIGAYLTLGARVALLAGRVVVLARPRL